MGLKSLLTTSSLDTSGPRSEGCYGWIIPQGFNIPVPYLWLSDWDSPKLLDHGRASLSCLSLAIPPAQWGTEHLVMG